MNRHFIGLVPLLLLPFLFWACSDKPKPQLQEASEPMDNLNPQGFKVVDYYPTTNGVQKVKTVITGQEAKFGTNLNTIYITLPKITGYREDGTKDWITTAEDGVITRNAQGLESVNGSNKVSMITANTNYYVCGRGFLWQHSNSMFILSNQSYTWVKQTALTNSSFK